MDMIKRKIRRIDVDNETKERKLTQMEEIEERERYLKSIGYVTKDTHYFIDVCRDRIAIDKAYSIVHNKLIEEKDNMTEEQREDFITQKQYLELLIIYYFMRDKGWKKGDNGIYIKEDSK